MNELKASVLLYVKHFTIYDYMAYTWLFLLFLILVMLSVIISYRSVVASVLIFLSSFILITLGPFGVKYLLDESVRAVKIENLSFSRLHFSDTLIVDFRIKNVSKIVFQECLTDIKVFKKSKSRLEYYKNILKPLRVKSILYKDILEKEASMDKRVVFDNFIYKGEDINVSVSSRCY